VVLQQKLVCGSLRAIELTFLFLGNIYKDIIDLALASKNSFYDYKCHFPIPVTVF